MEINFNQSFGDLEKYVVGKGVSPEDRSWYLFKFKNNQGAFVMESRDGGWIFIGVNFGLPHLDIMNDEDVMRKLMTTKHQRNRYIH